MTNMKNTIFTRMVTLSYKLLSFGLQLVGAVPPSPYDKNRKE